MTKLATFLKPADSTPVTTSGMVRVAWVSPFDLISLVACRPYQKFGIVV